jgi:hypothetical protein
MHEVRKPQAGAIRYSDKYAGDQVVVEPGNAAYPSALEVAEEFWHADTQQWVKISYPEKQNA